MWKHKYFNFNKLQKQAEKRYTERKRDRQRNTQRKKAKETYNMGKRETLLLAFDYLKLFLGKQRILLYPRGAERCDPKFSRRTMGCGSRGLTRGTRSRTTNSASSSRTTSKCHRFGTPGSRRPGQPTEIGMTSLESLCRWRSPMILYITTTLMSLLKFPWKRHNPLPSLLNRD